MKKSILNLLATINCDLMGINSFQNWKDFTIFEDQQHTIYKIRQVRIQNASPSLYYKITTMPLKHVFVGVLKY